MAVFGTPILIENSKQIGIPQYFWKIILPLETGQNLSDITGNTQVIAVIMPNRPQLADSTGLHFVPLPNGVQGKTITRWNDWQEWQISVDDLETITGYDFFSNLPDDVEEQLQAREDDSFINDYMSPSLLTDSTVIPSETLLLQTGVGVNLSIGQSHSGSTIPDIRNTLGASKINIGEKSISLNYLTPNSSSERAFSERSKLNISSPERSFISITPIKVSSNQDAIIEVSSTQVGILKSSSVQVSSLETSSF